MRAHSVECTLRALPATRRNLAANLWTGSGRPPLNLEVNAAIVDTHGVAIDDIRAPLYYQLINNGWETTLAGAAALAVHPVGTNENPGRALGVRLSARAHKVSRVVERSVSRQKPEAARATVVSALTDYASWAAQFGEVDFQNRYVNALADLGVTVEPDAKPARRRRNSVATLVVVGALVAILVAALAMMFATTTVTESGSSQPIPVVEDAPGTSEPG